MNQAVITAIVGVIVGAVVVLYETYNTQKEKQQQYQQRRTYKPRHEENEPTEFNAKKRYNRSRIPNCSICPNSVEEGEIIIANCDHLFHRSCFKQWLQQHQNCPLCDKRIVL
ncbi:hypothetical protein HHI36_012496 [Cryptolaemus montrouzieri]|uniref:RING-type domain-containing protein n=1 Tax=Cryptolaemus montrouzieri TaxID=559131 RepID=A0ABD2NFH0_9CUCU